MTDVKQDPELLEDPEEGQGDAIVYDLGVVLNTPFDAEQFELPEDYEYEGDDND
jgi:hypothetical protein